MREVFLEYAKSGAMTKEELAAVLQVSPETVRRRAKRGVIPRIPHIREVRFDPMKMIEVFCDTPGECQRSMKIERASRAKSPKGVISLCL